jgi:hypothetical protein
VDRDLLHRFPREYAGLAYLLTHSGYQPSDRSPTRGSAAERDIRASQDAWLRRSRASWTGDEDDRVARVRGPERRETADGRSGLELPEVNAP